MAAARDDPGRDASGPRGSSALAFLDGPTPADPPRRWDGPDRAPCGGDTTAAADGARAGGGRRRRLRRLPSRAPRDAPTGYGAGAALDPARGAAAPGFVLRRGRSWPRGARALFGRRAAPAGPRYAMAGAATLTRPRSSAEIAGRSRS